LTGIKDTKKAEGETGSSESECGNEFGLERNETHYERPFSEKKMRRGKPATQMLKSSCTEGQKEIVKDRSERANGEWESWQRGVACCVVREL
jgi:hypothetical protein